MTLYRFDKMARRSYSHDEMMELESEALDHPENRLVLEESHPIQQPGSSKTGFPHLGIVMAIASSFFFSLSSLIVKLVPDVHPVALATYRFTGIFLPSIPIVVYRAEDPFPKGKRLLLLLRAFLGTTSLMSQFYALRHMPLADASVIIFSVPVFVAIFARIFLKVCPIRLINVPTSQTSSISCHAGRMRALPCPQHLLDAVRMHLDCPASVPVRPGGLGFISWQRVRQRLLGGRGRPVRYPLCSQRLRRYPIA